MEGKRTWSESALSVVVGQSLAAKLRHNATLQSRHELTGRAVVPLITERVFKSLCQIHLHLCLFIMPNSKGKAKANANKKKG